jgi:hypothetical protein
LPYDGELELFNIINSGLCAAKCWQVRWTQAAAMHAARATRNTPNIVRKIFIVVFTNAKRSEGGKNCMFVKS